MRIGIFGGSFDPVHIGHLWIAEAAWETLGLKTIHWMPAAASPLKPHGTIASAEDRLEMLRLATSGCEQFEIDDREIRRGGPSYTVDTVSEIREENPGAEIILIIGSDSLADIGRWHQAERLLDLAIPAVVQRGGQSDIDFSVLSGLVDQKRLQLIRQHVIVMPVIEVSSSELRSRRAQNRSIRFRTPRAVEAMIHARGLYREGLK